MNTSMRGHDTTPQRVLLVEDSRSLNRYLAESIRETAGVEVVGVGSLREAAAQLEAHRAAFFVGVLDLHLPDAPDGEIVDLAVKHDLPTIVLTGSFSEAMRERILAKPHVIDYILKTNSSEITHIADLVRRIYRNQNIRILIVDDSRSFRLYLRTLLAAHRYQIIEASDGEAALDKLREPLDIHLMLTDFHMPGMDGEALVAETRKGFDRSTLGIIGISDQNAPITSVKLLKAGANDFIAKPFLTEEFYCRITQNVETLEFIQVMRDSAVRDFLTQLHNRRYLFDVGQRAYERAKLQRSGFAAAMIDVDHFKRINDTHGHLIGDRVLQHIAAVIAANIHPDDVLARYGGEEFCLLLHGTRASQQLDAELERIRAAIEALDIPNGTEKLRVTASLGATLNPSHSLAAMLDIADAALYLAKTQGRNRVWIS